MGAVGIQARDGRAEYRPAERPLTNGVLASTRRPSYGSQHKGVDTPGGGAWGFSRLQPTTNPSPLNKGVTHLGAVVTLCLVKSLFGLSSRAPRSPIPLVGYGAQSACGLACGEA